MSQLLSRYKWHILFWGIYFIFWTLYSVFDYGTAPLQAFLTTFVWFLGQAGVSYMVIYWLIPRYFNTKRYYSFVILLLGGMLLSALFILAAMTGIFRLFSRSAPYVFKSEF